jgi:hypothetical protein
VTLLVTVAVLTGCQTSADVRAVRSVAPVGGTTPQNGPDTTDPAGQHFEVEQFALEFTLPDSFSEIDPGSLDWAARSMAPQAYFTIAAEDDDPDLLLPEPEPGEVVVALSIDGHDAVEITNAHLDGLPEGIAAAELYVANGDRSFSVIMSAPEDSLVALWETFMSSVSVVDDE